MFSGTGSFNHPGFLSTLLEPGKSEPSTFCVWQLAARQRANSFQAQNTETFSSAQRSLLKGETE
jgi:hypothetical protein